MLADAHVESSKPALNLGSSPWLCTSDLLGHAVAYLRFDLSGVRRPVLHAKLSLRNVEDEDASERRKVFLVSQDGWDEATITFDSAPELGPSLGTIPEASRDATCSFGVTAVVNQETDSVLTLAVGAPKNGQPSKFLSRESGAAPRLVIIEAPRGE